MKHDLMREGRRIMMKKSFAMLLTLLLLMAFVQPTSAHTVHDGAAPELLNKEMQIHTIAAGYIHTVAIREDGKVVTAGSNDKCQCNVKSWTDIVSVAAGDYHTVGLKSDGTVVVAGDYSYAGGWGVSGWTDIVAIAGGGRHVVGLKSDGTVVVGGETGEGVDDVSDWRDIVAVAAGRLHTVGLKSDGTVVATKFDNSWGARRGRDTSAYDRGQSEVDDWTDIVAIEAGKYHTVGLKSDGTVVAVGDNEYGQCDVSDWTDIIAVAAGELHTVGLKADGTVVAVGRNNYTQINVSGLSDVVQIAAGGLHTVALKADGSVVSIGARKQGQGNACDWTNIRVPQR